MSSQEQREHDRRNALRYVMSDARGRHFLHMLMEEAGMYTQGWQGDVNALLVQEGRRHVALWVRGNAKAHDRRMYAMLLREAEEREAHYDTLEELSHG